MAHSSPEDKCWPFEGGDGSWLGSAGCSFDDNIVVITLINRLVQMPWKVRSAQASGFLDTRFDQLPKR